MFENKKIKVFNKLIGTGICSAQQFLRMSGADLIYSIPNLEPDELSDLIAIQDSVRDGNLFECLCGKENYSEVKNEY